MRAHVRWGSLVLLWAVVACDATGSDTRGTSVIGSGDSATAPADTRTAGAPDTSLFTVAAYPELSDTLAPIRLAIRNALAPIRLAIRNAPATLRPDSATSAADATFDRLSRDLEERVASLTVPFSDRTFQADIAPYGAAAQARRRSEAQASVFPREQALADSLTSLLAANGVWVQQNEGDTDYSLNRSLLLNQLGPYLTAGGQEYLALQVEEQIRPAAEDAALTLALDRVTERLLRREQFLAAYPDSPHADSVRDSYDWYLQLYLEGLPNTPAVSRQSGRLDGGRREHMEQFVNKHGDTSAGQAVSRFLALPSDKASPPTVDPSPNPE